jgi:hypothetical protein
MNKRGFLIGTLMLVLTVGARAQQESRVNHQGEEKITTATNLVTVNVIVTDRNGRYMTGLGRDQFEVYDEKLKQQIAHFSNKAAPVSVGIVCEIQNRTPEKTHAGLCFRTVRVIAASIVSRVADHCCLKRDCADFPKGHDDKSGAGCRGRESV